MSKITLLTESSFNTETITEADSDGVKSWYLNGVFMQADVVNRNHRIYPRGIMENEINSYIKEYVVPRRAVGELSHPDTASINLDKITHIIESIEQRGNNFYGKAKILNTPSGNIIKGLLEGGVQLGVSSRGRGSVVTNSKGINEVQKDFKLGAIDIVYQPSAPDAFVDGLMEGESFVWDSVQEDTEFLQGLKEGIHNTKIKDIQEAKMAAFAKFMNMIRG